MVGVRNRVVAIPIGRRPFLGGEAVPAAAPSHFDQWRRTPLPMMNNLPMAEKSRQPTLKTRWYPMAIFGTSVIVSGTTPGKQVLVVGPGTWENSGEK